MDLFEIEISRYRSIREQTKGDSIEFGGLDCLVGKNNAGKTNILSAIKFLFGQKEEKRLDEELFWDKDTRQTVEVRGFLNVTEKDLDRIASEGKREEIEDMLLNEHGYENTLGICRIQPADEDSINPQFQLLQSLPDSDHLSEDSFIETRNEWWEKASNDEIDFTKKTYSDGMKEKYPKITQYITEKKEKQKKAWKDAYDSYVTSRPKNVDFTLQPTSFSGTKTIVQEELLPQLISIPAVREVESTTKRGGEFGNLVDQLSNVIQEELDEHLQNKLDDFRVDDHPSVEKIEQTVSEHLQSTFENRSVSFNFPEFSTKYLFRDADIQIGEDDLGPLSKENVGQGVKRTLIFSLLRTLADIQEGRLSLTQNERGKEQHRPLLILFEEAELFLHPRLQKTLLTTFSQLTDGNTQIIFTTHSPFLIEYEIIETINIVRKNNTSSTYVTQYHTVLERRDETEQSRLTGLQSVSSYIFADEVVLVEGMSDLIVFRKLASHLNDDWGFDKHGIPVLNVGGKGEMKRFKAFLEGLDIATHIVVDLDAVHNEVSDLVKSDEVKELRDTLEEQVDGVRNESRYAHEKLPKEVRMSPWNDTFDQLEDLHDRLTDEDTTTREDAKIIKRVLSKCEIGSKTEAWLHEDLELQRIQLIELLLEENVLLLSGDLESYYPNNGSNKREAALSFQPAKFSSEKLRSRFTTLDAYETTDVEKFLSQIF
jgi:putative ATP-dependent endonuclease of OLD family